MRITFWLSRWLLLAASAGAGAGAAVAADERAHYAGLFAASAQRRSDDHAPRCERYGAVDAAATVMVGTPLHVAAYAKAHDAMRASRQAPARDPNALERDRYDIVTIAAVADDVPHARRLALAVGGSAYAT